MFLQSPPDSEAADRLCQSDLDERGYVMNLTRLWGWRPEVCEAFAGVRSLLSGQSALSVRDRGVLVCATAATLGDSYCALAWGQALAASADAALAAAVLQGGEGGELTARDRALAAWARKVAADPNATRHDDVDGLRAAGLGDKEIFEATAFIAFRIAFSTINDALGVRPDWQVAAAAPDEVRAAVTFGRPPAEPAN